MANASVKVHGGLNLQGQYREIQNLELQTLDSDPSNPEIAGIWFNTNSNVNKVSYNDATGNIRRVASDIDISNILSITQKAVTNNTATNFLFGQPVYTVANTAPPQSDTNNIVFWFNVNGIPVKVEYNNTVNSSGGIEDLTNIAVDLANANNSNSINVMGMVASTGPNANGGALIVSVLGTLTGSTSQWDALTGQTGGLTPNAKYFLDINNGRITAVPPITTACFLAPLGTALSETIFSINISNSIKL